MNFFTSKPLPTKCTNHRGQPSCGWSTERVFIVFGLNLRSSFTKNASSPKKKLKKSATINIAGRRVPLCAYEKTLHLDNQAQVHGGPRRN